MAIETKKIVALHFENFEAYLADTQTDRSKWSKNRKRYSRDDTCGGQGAKWAGGTWAEVNQAAREGWKDGRARMVAGLERANTLNKPAPRRSRGYDVAGAYPHVARAVAGDPCSMVSLGDCTVAARPIVRLVIPRGASCVVKPHQMENYGIALLSHVDAMENEGYSVEITTTDTSHGYDGVLLDVRCIAKRAGEPLDLDRLAFILAHPGMFRRLGFTFVENYMSEQWAMGYGSPIRLKPEQLDADQNYVPGIDYTAGHKFDTLESALETLATIRPGYTTTDRDGELGQA
jgi:hypothetical protein